MGVLVYDTAYGTWLAHDCLSWVAERPSKAIPMPAAPEIEVDVHATRVVLHPHVWQGNRDVLVFYHHTDLDWAVAADEAGRSYALDWTRHYVEGGLHGGRRLPVVPG